jgi:hypothetical protein
MNRSPIAGLVAAAVLVGSLGAAHADPDEPRSPTVATFLSLGGVVGSGLVMAVGAGMDGSASSVMVLAGAASLLVTPALGEIYSGRYLSAGTLTRVAGAGLAAAGVGCALSSINHGGCGEALFTGMVAVGAGVFVTGAVLDLALAGTAAEDFNRKHGFAIAPGAIVTPSGSSPTLGLSGRF